MCFAALYFKHRVFIGRCECGYSTTQNLCCITEYEEIRDPCLSINVFRNVSDGEYYIFKVKRFLAS